jgi:hypothetical protein
MGPDKSFFNHIRRAAARFSLYGTPTVQGLRQGFIAIRQLADAMSGKPVALSDSAISTKLLEQLALEAKKFVIYRAYRIRDRQWLSLQRMRALIEMIREAQLRTS